MPAQSGSPRECIVQQQRFIGPTELGLSATVYAVGIANQTRSNAVDVQGFGMWSVYISATTNANVDLIVMEEVAETVELTQLAIGAIAAGVTRHFTFGQVGSSLAVVPWRLIKLAVYGAAVGGTTTARLFGRAF